MTNKFEAAVEDVWRRSGGTGDFAYLFAELEKFMDLTRTAHGPIAMTSKRIDEVWHAFICCTEAYQQYCIENFGVYLHHRPRSMQFQFLWNPSGTLSQNTRRHMGQRLQYGSTMLRRALGHMRLVSVKRCPNLPLVRLARSRLQMGPQFL